MNIFPSILTKLYRKFVFPKRNWITLQWLTLQAKLASAQFVYSTSFFPIPSLKMAVNKFTAIFVFVIHPKETGAYIMFSEGIELYE